MELDEKIAGYLMTCEPDRARYAIDLSPQESLDVRCLDPRKDPLQCDRAGTSSASPVRHHDSGGNDVRAQRASVNEDLLDERALRNDAIFEARNVDELPLRES